MKTSILYTQAISSINNHVDSKQSDLDERARAAREVHLAAVKAAPLQDVTEEDPIFHVAHLLSNTVSVGRDDGYPAVVIPDETREVLIMARNAEMLPSGPDGTGYQVGGLTFYNDFSGVSHDLPEKSNDYNSWNEARKYSQKNRANDAG